MCSKIQIIRIFWLLLAATISVPAGAEDLIGQATVIDGDTIDIHGTRIRLWGIDAPESSQLCRGDDSLPYRCGAEAANGLDAFIARRPVACIQVDTDRYGRAVAKCTVGGVDLGEWLVSRGHALDWPRYSHGKYTADQEHAKTADSGMWRGSFIEPWRFRGCVKAGGRIEVCSDEVGR